MGSIGVGNRGRVDTVAVIGAGPSGLAAAKYLVAEQRFSRIVVFEQRSDVGGLWNHVPCDKKLREDLQIPQTNPHAGHDNPIRINGQATKSPAFMSPVYDRLETNIPRGLMGFSDLDWPSHNQLFPGHDQVLEYIQQYSADIRHLISFATQVLDVRPLADRHWSIESRRLGSTQNEDSRTEIFDAVVVANGHFNVPFIPPVDGIEVWHKTFPGTITHSKFFRKPEDYAGKKVVVVGNAASGIDIGAQIRKTCKKPLIQSSTSESYLQPEQSPDQIEKPRILRYDAADRAIHFADGTVELGVDVVLYCTGYLYSFPFLESLRPPIIDTGERVERLYKHIFYQPIPTLAFLGLNQKVIPFPVGEAQAAVVARVFADRLVLPSQKTMEDWEQQTLRGTPRIRDFHLLKFPSDADYINELHDWAVRADHESSISQTTASEEALDDTLVGKRPPYWTKQDYWTRENFPAIKKAFHNFGEERHSKLTLTDVGFDYQTSQSERK